MADVNNPIYYKWYPTEETDLGANPIEGEFGSEDRIVCYDETGMATYFFPNPTTHEWGRNVRKQVAGRWKTVWEAGVTVKPVEHEGMQLPVWYKRTSDVGVAALKVPNGEEVEEVTPE